jgi:dipeptidyl aminopeptidase/acylaminoacyl peptidase
MNAVDKVVEMGMADPGKLVGWGQSYGGYSTYTLVTYTQRFKAAGALAGLSDLVSLYGILDARERYDRYPHEFPFAAILSESGQIRMGDTPWGDLWRYLRNSPLYYLDRVQTPFMIVQGDLDYVTLEPGRAVLLRSPAARQAGAVRPLLGRFPHP